MNHTYQYLKEEFNIDEKVLKLVAEAEEEVRGEFEKLDDIMAYNQYKVLKAFQKNRIREMHFGWKTGYGYHFWVSRHGCRGDGASGQLAVILEEQELAYDADEGACIAQISTPIDAGDVLTVKYDGMTYKCEASNIDGSIVFGNLSFAGLETNSGEPLTASK